MTPGRRRQLALALFAAASAVACRLGPHSWSLRSTSGAGCSVEEGLPRSEVVKQCGVPDATGGQPKRSREGAGPGSFCSAPCERYADRLLLYDCDGHLAEVETVAGYQGCVFLQQVSSYGPE